MWPFPPRLPPPDPSAEAPPPPKAPFAPETLIADIEFTWPEASRRIFKELGIHCHGCAVGETDTLKDVAHLHQRPLEPLMEALNKAFAGLPPEEEFGGGAPATSAGVPPAASGTPPSAPTSP